MKVFHPLHRTAKSIRTTGFPVLFADAAGNVIGQCRSQKQPGFWLLPDETKIVLLLYVTNSGRRNVVLFEPMDGLPWRGTIYDTQLGELDDVLAQLGIEPNSQAAESIMQWLAGWLEL